MNEHSLIHWDLINIMIYDECGEQFSKAQDLEHHSIQKHASTLHKKQQYFLCNYCNATVKSRKSLLRHVKEQHETD